MSTSLPRSASLEWLRKTAKQRLKRLRQRDPNTRLATVQFDLAREYGFASWRSLKTVVEQSTDSDEVVSVARSLLRAVGSGDDARVTALLSQTPDLVNAVAPHPFWGGGCQALHIAVDTNRPAMVDLLLSQGADPHGHNEHYDHWSPLMLAAHNKQQDIVATLLSAGARVGLLEALLQGDDPTLDTMIASTGIPPCRPSGSLIALARTPYAVDLLIEHGMKTDGVDRWGSDVVDSLSRLGADGAPLLERLQHHGHSITEEALAHMGDLTTLRERHRTNPRPVVADRVVVAACDFGHIELVTWLLETGANVNARSHFGAQGTLLHSAAWGGNVAMAQLLIDAGADAELRDREHNSTPLGWAETAVTVTNNPECSEVAEYLRSLAN